MNASDSFPFFSYDMASYNFPIFSPSCTTEVQELTNSQKLPQIIHIASDIDKERNEHEEAISNLKQALTLMQRIDRKHEMIFEPKYEEEEMTQKHLKLANSLKCLQLHFNFILEILTVTSEEEIPEILLRYKPINRNYNPIAKKEDICLLIINDAFKNAILCVIKEAEKATDIFFVLRGDGSLVINTDPEALDYVQIVTSKLETMIEYFPDAATLDSNDIFAQSRTSQTWKNLEKGVETVILAEKEVLKNRWKKMYMLLTILNAMVYKHQQIDNKTIKDKLKGAFSALYFGAKMKEAEVKASLYLSNPQMNSAFQVWNFAENGIIKELMKFTLPTIDYDRKLYIHRLFPSINRETILKEYEEGSLTRIYKDTFQPVNLAPKKDLILNSIFTKQADAVAIRLIAPYPLVIQGNNSEMARAMAMKAVNRFNQFLKQGKNQPNSNPEGIIIHIHGGGFVSGSSATHRNYLYRWAKNLNKTIFSIDYRLAPDYPYPAALDDVWQAYNWIINYAEPLLGIKTNNIILAGDSAGGNLVMALTLRAIKMGIKVPDGCFLAYPALNMCPKKFVPSYYLAIQDTILPYSMLKLCIKAYIPEEFMPMIDPFLSPLMASDEMLEKLPPTRIITGNSDPLHDDNWRLLHRMQALEKDVKMIVYDNMPHGFMSFDQIEDYQVVVEKTCKVLDELFHKREVGTRRKTLRLSSSSSDPGSINLS